MNDYPPLARMIRDEAARKVICANAVFRDALVARHIDALETGKRMNRRKRTARIRRGHR